VFFKINIKQSVKKIIKEQCMETAGRLKNSPKNLTMSNERIGWKSLEIFSSRFPA
jgi:hypothetical protein